MSHDRQRNLPVSVNLPRVLLIEDDASIRRFVELALEDQLVELVQADCLLEARRLVREEGPFRLLISDLMLPDGSGLDLLHELMANPGLRAGARLAVFSAGISAERRQFLQNRGVDEVIAKPASLAQLLACVERALLDRASEVQAPTGGAAQDARGADLAVAQYFAGDRELYVSYRASCVAQFVHDQAMGDAALDRGDVSALRRLAHSLKTVLQTLGHGTASDWARTLETDAAEGRTDAAAKGWIRLSAELRRVGTP